MTGTPLPETCRTAEQATIWIWPGQAAYLGPSLNLDAHSGSVHCFALGVDAPFTLRARNVGERRTRSALIPARTQHQLIAATGRMLFFYLDPDLAKNVHTRMTEHTATIAFNYQHESSLICHARKRHSPTRPNCGTSSLSQTLPSWTNESGRPSTSCVLTGR